MIYVYIEPDNITLPALNIEANLYHLKILNQYLYLNIRIIKSQQRMYFKDSEDLDKVNEEIDKSVQKQAIRDQ